MNYQWSDQTIRATAQPDRAQFLPPSGGEPTSPAYADISQGKKIISKNFDGARKASLASSFLSYDIIRTLDVSLVTRA